MKTIKTLAVLAISLSVITLNSCKKKDEKPAVSITATVDGTATSFNVNAAALQGTVQGITFTKYTGQHVWRRDVIHDPVWSANCR